MSESGVTKFFPATCYGRPKEGLRKGFRGTGCAWGFLFSHFFNQSQDGSKDLVGTSWQKAEM